VVVPSPATSEVAQAIFREGLKNVTAAAAGAESSS
jgi:hypothetical protein